MRNWKNSLCSFASTLKFLLFHWTIKGFPVFFEYWWKFWGQSPRCLIHMYVHINHNNSICKLIEMELIGIRLERFFSSENSYWPVIRLVIRTHNIILKFFSVFYTRCNVIAVDAINGISGHKNCHVSMHYDVGKKRQKGRRSNGQKKISFGHLFDYTLLCSMSSSTSSSSSPL